MALATPIYRSNPRSTRLEEEVSLVPCLLPSTASNALALYVGVAAAANVVKRPYMYKENLILSWLINICKGRWAAIDCSRRGQLYYPMCTRYSRRHVSDVKDGEVIQPVLCQPISRAALMELRERVHSARERAEQPMLVANYLLMARQLVVFVRYATWLVC